MEQTTAEEALKRLEPLVGERTLEAKPPDGPPWSGDDRVARLWGAPGAALDG
jgi:hypothetical protein